MFNRSPVINIIKAQAQEAKKNMPRGRPSSYTDAIAHEICERMSEGESLRKVCSDPKMPSMSMVFRWLANENNAEFRDQYARAREAQADKYADELVDIADEGKSEDANIIRLRMDARKWAASKLAPKKYGERLDLNHGGSVNINIGSDDADL